MPRRQICINILQCAIGAYSWIEYVARLYIRAFKSFISADKMLHCISKYSVKHCAVVAWCSL